MASGNTYSINNLTAGGGTLNLPTGIGVDFTSDGLEQTYFITCSATLAASWTVQASGTLAAGLYYRIIYDGTSGTVVTTAANTITIFGVQLTQAQANSKLEIHVDYSTSSAYTTRIVTSEDNKAIGNPGIADTALTSGGGTITLNPLVDKTVQYFSGTATLAGSWVITGGGSTLPHSFWIYYNAALTVGVNSVTIFGQTLTSAEALNGGVSFFVTYDSNSSSYRAQKMTGSGTAALYVAQTIFVDTVYGNNSSAAVNRQDLPYLTYAAARTAAVALSPSTSSPIWIRVRGNIAETITLANGVNVDLTNVDLNLASGNSTHAISDAGSACTSYVLANKITRSGTGTGGVYAIGISNASSNVVVKCTDIVSSTTTNTDAAIACVNGTLSVYCNDITAYNWGIASSAGTLYVNGKNVNSSTSTCIVASGGTQELYVNDITSTLKSGISLTGGTQTVYCNNVTASGSSATGSCVNGSAGTQNVFCNNLTMNNNASQTIYASGTIVQTVKVKETITGSSYSGGAIQAENLTGSQIVEFEYATAAAVVISPIGTTTGVCRYKGRILNSGSGNAVYIASDAASLFTLVTDNCQSTDGDCVDMSLANHTATIRLRGRFVSGGSNKHCITSGAGASAPVVILEGATTLVPTGTGKSIYSGTASTPVKVYTGVVGSVAVSTNITQQVSTVTVDANVI